MRYLEIILSSAVIVAILQYLQGNKGNHLQYITTERTQWRRSIKEILDELSLSDSHNLNGPLTKLKCNLNGYGYHSSGEYPKPECLDYMTDEHIWREIDFIEKSVRCGDNQSLEQHKNTLVMSLVLLLKFDWERSKKEVRSAVELPITILLFAVGICMFLIGRYGIAGIGDKIEQCIFWGGTMIWLYGMAWLPYLLEMPKAFRRKKWYRKPGGVVFSGIFFMLFCLLMNTAKNNYYDLLAGFSIIICVISFAVSIFYPVVSNSVYRDYEDNLYRMLLKNELKIYTGSMMVGTFFSACFTNYNLLIKTEKISRELDFQKVFQECDPGSLVSLRCSHHYLRIKSWVKYLWVRLVDYTHGVQHAKTVKQFVEEKPDRCRTVVEYISEDNKKRYSIGINKKLWNQWFE